MITAGRFFDARHMFEAEAPRPESVALWLDVAKGLSTWPQRERWRVNNSDGRVYLATQVGKDGVGWFDLRWCIASELLDPGSVADARSKVGERIVSIRDVAVSRCPSCGESGLVVGRDSGSNDAAGDPVCTTEVLLLCLTNPHVSILARNTSYDWCSA